MLVKVNEISLFKTLVILWRNGQFSVLGWNRTFTIFELENGVSILHEYFVADVEKVSEHFP